jgi:hypothetical protein
MTYSIPCSIPINEAYRLLAYLKCKYQPGFIRKEEIKNLCRLFGKDKRTIARLLKTLKEENLIGENQNKYFLRSWKFITLIKGFNLQSFSISLKEIRNKKKFEAILFSSKVTSLQKAIRRGLVRKKGCTFQSPSTGLLAKSCSISHGKVTQLQRIAEAYNLLSIEKQFEVFGNSTIEGIKILRKEVPGVFLKDGLIKRRTIDKIESRINTYRIKNRKARKP